MPFSKEIQNCLRDLRIRIRNYFILTPEVQTQTFCSPVPDSLFAWENTTTIELIPHCFVAFLLFFCSLQKKSNKRKRRFLQCTPRTKPNAPQQEKLAYTQQPNTLWQQRRAEQKKHLYRRSDAYGDTKPHRWNTWSDLRYRPKREEKIAIKAMPKVSDVYSRINSDRGDAEGIVCVWQRRLKTTYDPFWVEKKSG